MAALLLLGAHAAQLGHDLEQRHYVCPEHGERVHGGHAADAEPSTERHLSPRPAAADAAHEHCGLGHATPATAPAEPAALVSAAPSLPAPRAHARAATTPIALLHLAPKSSPPIVA